MVYKPNYNQQRAERNRAKQAKQEAKQEAKRRSARRKLAASSLSRAAKRLPPEGPAPARPMAPKRKILSSFVAFDGARRDGTRSSNRRAPFTELGGLDGDTPAKAIIEAQDREISTCARAGPAPTSVRSPARPRSPPRE